MKIKNFILDIATKNMLKERLGESSEAVVKFELLRFVVKQCNDMSLRHF